MPQPEDTYCLLVSQTYITAIRAIMYTYQVDTIIDLLYSTNNY
jgi:hypothetical protein